MGSGHTNAISGSLRKDSSIGHLCTTSNGVKKIEHSAQGGPMRFPPSFLFGSSQALKSHDKDKKPLLNISPTQTRVFDVETYCFGFPKEAQEGSQRPLYAHPCRSQQDKCWQTICGDMQVLISYKCLPNDSLVMH